MILIWQLKDCGSEMLNAWQDRCQPVCSTITCWPFLFSTFFCMYLNTSMKKSHFRKTTEKHFKCEWMLILSISSRTIVFSFCNFSFPFILFKMVVAEPIWSQECPSGLPHAYSGNNTWTILHYFPINRELNQKWSSWDQNWLPLWGASTVGRSLTYHTTAPALLLSPYFYKLFHLYKVYKFHLFHNKDVGV